MSMTGLFFKKLFAILISIIFLCACFFTAFFIVNQKPFQTNRIIHFETHFVVIDKQQYLQLSQQYQEIILDNSAISIAADAISFIWSDTGLFCFKGSFSNFSKYYPTPKSVLLTEVSI